MKKKKKSKKPFQGFKHRLFNLPIKERNRVLFIIITIAALYLAFLYFSDFELRMGSIDAREVTVGVPAERDVVVDKEIVYHDSQATKLKREAERKLILPVFKQNDEVTNNIIENFETFEGIITRPGMQEAGKQKVIFELQSELPGVFDRDSIFSLLDSDSLYGILPTARELLEDIVNTGIVNESVLNDLFVPGAIEIWRWNEGKNEKTVVPVDEIITKNRLDDRVRSWSKEHAVSPSFIPHLLAIANRLVEINTFFDAEETAENKKRAAESVGPIKRKLQAGEYLLKAGDIVTRGEKEKISAVEAFSKKINLFSILSSALFLGFLTVLVVFLLRPPLTAIRLNNTQLFILLSFFMVYMIIAIVVDRLLPEEKWMPFALFLPTAFFTMLVAVLVNTRVAFYVTFFSALAVLFITGLEAASFLFALFSGTSAILLIKNAQKRIDLIRGIFLLSIVSGVIMMLISFLKQADSGELPRNIGFGLLNGAACGILNLGILPILEHLLNVPTRFRLFELSDTNAPVLKKMLTMAPGTYNHSINVANMAEAACKEIGANPLLARIGAYYHDIGKIEQAEYFIENQKESNKLVDLKPSLSVAVIKSHVKMGVEKAKELKLPKAIIDLIAQHHGSGLISYFYSEALKNEGNSKINKEDYSYSEPIPATKEAAVIMLADTVDAAVRTLKKPTIAKIEKFIWDLFLYKIRERQFVECDLTTGDLEKIKTIFVHLLTGYFHARIEYPNTKEEAV
jgi:cyclic-di-AMP phosphodiesterase PgpH